MLSHNLKICCLIFLLSAGTLFSGNRPENSAGVLRIRNLIFNQHLQTADSLLNIELAENPENPRLNLLKALLLLKKNITEDRIRACDLIEVYGKKIPEDALTQFLWGYLFKSGGKRAFTAKYFKKAIETEPHFVEAMVELGELYYQEMLEYLHRFSDHEIPLSFHRFAQEDFRNAEKYLNMALKQEPLNERALYLLGLLYYEEKELDKMISLYKKALAYDSNDVDFNLFIGLAYQEEKKFSLSNRYFKTALAKMDTEERLLYLDPQIFIEGGTVRDEPEFYDDFWTSRDPLFLTGENERLCEHIARMAYANLRFSVPKMNIKGCFTDRGRAYVRYGHPAFIMAVGKDIGLAPLERWFYPGFKLEFEDEFWNGNYRFATPDLKTSDVSAFKSRADGDYVIRAKELFTTVPEIYDFSLGGGKFSSEYNFAAFKGQGDNTEMMVSFELPIDGFAKIDSIHYKEGIFLSGNNSKDRQSFIENLRPDYKIHAYQLTRNKLIDNIRFQVKPDVYQYSLELVEEQNKAMFVSRDSIRIPDFSGNSLMVSDIILADKIEQGVPNSNFIRNNLFILPNIRRQYKQNGVMYIYFEIYNLLPDEQDETFYIIENSLIADSHKSFISKLFGKSASRATIVNAYSGKQPDDFVLQAINLADLKAGNYHLEIKISDQNSGEIITKKEAIQILGDN